jgi:hypothetical protein
LITVSSSGAAKGAAANLLLGQRGEPALDQIELDGPLT